MVYVIDSDGEKEEVIKDKKKKKSREKKTYVFEIKLTDYTNENYTEFNWKQLVKNEEEKKLDPDIEIIDIDDDPAPKKKKFNPATVDPEDDYDLDDDFIDDAELNDEEVPEGVSTAHGGFYINTGSLQYFQTIPDDDPAPVQVATRRGELVFPSPKKCITIICDDSKLLKCFVN